MARHEAPSYLAEPTIQYLVQVLEQMHAGEIQFPRFQRFGVWKRSQRLELLRSIREGIPIGTLLLWRTRRQDVHVERRIGMHMLPEARKGDTTRQYVLDGVQRLSTLYGALYTPNLDTTAEDDERPDDFRFYYDLREQEFIVHSELVAGPKSRHLPLTTILSSVRLLKFQRAFRDRDADTYTERADALARAFREYKVPVVPLASDDLAYATKTFQRVNTQGTTMSEVHMVNALVYSKDFDLLQDIGEARQELFAPIGWNALDDESVLRTIKALLGIDVYATQPDETRIALRKRPSIVGDALRALVRAAEFFRDELNIYSPALVPYAAQIVLLARTLHHEPSPTSAGRVALADWIALTTYTELFASNMSASRFDVLAAELRGASQGEDLQWNVRRPLARRELPAIFDFRHARARFLALDMARAQRTGRSDGHVDPCLALSHDGVAVVPQLLTHRMAGAARGAWMQSPGGRVVAAEGTLGELRQELLSPRASPKLLDRHLISAEVHKLLVGGRLEEAIRKRTEVLNERERTGFAELLSRHKPLSQAALKTAGNVATQVVSRAARRNVTSIPAAEESGVAKFLAAWAQLEIVRARLEPTKQRINLADLPAETAIDDGTRLAYRDLRRLRNELVHSPSSLPRGTDFGEAASRVRAVTRRLSTLVKQ